MSDTTGAPGSDPHRRLRDHILIIALRAYHEVGGNRQLFPAAFRGKCIDDDDALDILDDFLKPHWAQIAAVFFDRVAPPKTAEDELEDDETAEDYDEDETGDETAEDESTTESDTKASEERPSEKKAERQYRPRQRRDRSRKRYERRADVWERTFLQTKYVKLAGSSPKRMDLLSGRELYSVEMQYGQMGRFAGLLRSGMTDDMIAGECHTDNDKVIEMWRKAGNER